MTSINEDAIEYEVDLFLQVLNAVNREFQTYSISYQERIDIARTIYPQVNINAQRQLEETYVTESKSDTTER